MSDLSKEAREVIEDLTRWIEALALVGSPNAEAWKHYGRLSLRVEKVLGTPGTVPNAYASGRPTEVCPLGKPECTTNCGSYGCGN